jgi:hypothetical protein
LVPLRTCSAIARASGITVSVSDSHIALLYAAKPAYRMRHWIEINRAPVLTLWAAVVATRLGFESLLSG